MNIRLRNIAAAIAILFMPSMATAQVIQVDPTLTATIIGQTLQYKEIHKKRKKIQEQIIAAEAAVTLAMDRVHSVEDKMLKYLSEAQHAMSNLYQLKRAAELVAKEIPHNIAELGKAIPHNLKGTAITALVSDEIKDVSEQMMALYPFMKQLVTSGTYNVSGSDGKAEKHKVNLLNSAERYYIANEVLHRLETINIDLYILTWQVKTMSWGRLWFGLDPDGWITIMSGKNIAEALIGQWKNL